MSTERDHQELYDRLLEEVGALHRANQRRIRSGLRALLAVTVGLMLLMFLADGNKVFTLMLWILSMFAVAAYLIAVEYMDYELQKKLRDIAQLQEDAFDGLIELPELPAAPAEPVRPVGPYVTLPSGWEHVLEDPNRLADDLALLTRALQNLSDDLRRPAADHKKEGER